VGAQVGDVTLAARRPPTHDILDGACIEDAMLPDSSSNDRGGHQIDRHHRIRPDMLGASAAASRDSGQAVGRHCRQGSNRADGGLGVALPGEQGPTDLLGATDVVDIRAARTDPLGATDVGDIRAVLALNAGAQGTGHGPNVGTTTGGGFSGGLSRAVAPERKRKAKKKNESPSYPLYKKRRDNRGASR
jgi:hypothetical protein